MELTTEIVAAHAGNNAVEIGDLTQLIQDVYKT
ncbi:MAG TPA: MucR family transcriptional regulator, partial [Rhodospirillales bacterium]|nr:MucR family transcriptional regulator [Rhodospirillales bacterium]